MAMTMSGEYQLAVPRETVWEKLNDAETLKACIPGCEQLDKTSDTEFQAVAMTKIGPVKAKFKGKVTLSDLDPPNGYKISGQGDGGVAGFATGGATVKLEPKDGGTLLSYTSSRRSAASSRSSASAWSTAPRRNWPTIFSRNSPPRSVRRPPDPKSAAPLPTNPAAVAQAIFP